jgi:hypothetical protein
MNGSIRRNVLIAVMLNPCVSPEKCLAHEERALANEKESGLRDFFLKRIFERGM